MARTVTPTLPDLALCEAVAPEALPGDWIAERKLDGIRTVAVEGRLLTRSGRDITAKFPEIDPPSATVDGELVAVQGAFKDVNGRAQLTNGFDIDIRSEVAPARLLAFDVLDYDGEDLRDRPLTERAAHLHAATKDAAGVEIVEPHDDPAALWERAEAEGWEGIVAKDPTAPYTPGRSDRWLKCKTWEEAAFDVLDHGRTDNDGFVVYVDVGADDPQRIVANGEADQRAIVAGAETVEVQYLERTESGRLRKPSLKRVPR